jgi:hypothetical protein
MSIYGPGRQKSIAEIRKGHLRLFWIKIRVLEAVYKMSSRNTMNCVCVGVVPDSMSASFFGDKKGRFVPFGEY